MKNIRTKLHFHLAPFSTCWHTYSQQKLMKMEVVGLFVLGLSSLSDKGCGEGSIICVEESRDEDTMEDDRNKLCEIGTLSNY